MRLTSTQASVSSGPDAGVRASTDASTLLPGYRLYFRREGEVLIVLLVGGDKGSQRRDLPKAKEIWKRWKEGE